MSNVSVGGIITSGGHSFLFRRLTLDDTADIHEIARHNYGGRDYIDHALVEWLRIDVEDCAPMALEYVGTADDVVTGSDESERAPFIGHVVATETIIILDDGLTAWILGLRTHPAFRGLKLSSVLHANMIAKSATMKPQTLQRIRDSSTTDNTVSSYLANKHGFHVIHQLLFYLPLSQTSYDVMDYLTSRLLSLGVTVDDVQRRMRIGSVDDVMAIVKRHPDCADMNLLQQNWIAYEMSAANLKMLAASAHVMTVCSDNDGTLNSFSISHHHAVFSGKCQSFTVYATTLLETLMHIVYQFNTIRQQVSALDCQTMCFAPTLFEDETNGIRSVKPAMTSRSEHNNDADSFKWKPCNIVTIREKPLDRTQTQLSSKE